MHRRELVQYLPTSEVPLPKKKLSLGHTQVAETPSPILYKRNRTAMEGVEGNNVVKRLKSDAEDKEDKVLCKAPRPVESVVFAVFVGGTEFSGR